MPVTCERSSGEGLLGPPLTDARCYSSGSYDAFGSFMTLSRPLRIADNNLRVEPVAYKVIAVEAMGHGSRQGYTVRHSREPAELTIHVPRHDVINVPVPHLMYSISDGKHGPTTTIASARPHSS